MIALYGATGYTGRLVTDELVRRGADLVLGGRSVDKLERLSEERANGAPTRAASVDDPASLHALLQGCEVVINCAGPFSRLGEPVVRAALESGTHYLGPAAEQAFLQKVFERYGEEAERSGVALVPGAGFQVGPGDCLARLAARDHEPLAEVVVAYALDGFGASRGAALSALEAMGGGDVVFRGGSWQPAPPGVSRRGFDFPDPVGAQPTIPLPGGEVITVPRHTETRAVTVLLGVSAFVPHPAFAPVVPFLGPALAAALQTPLRQLAERAIERLPEGPSEEDRQAGEFTVVAEARAEDGRLRRGVVRGRDLYATTAATLVHGAEQMERADYDRVGVLGPAAAFDPEAFLDSLRDRGVTWELPEV